jgi:hypothetical protein
MLITLSSDMSGRTVNIVLACFKLSKGHILACSNINTATKKLAWQDTFTRSALFCDITQRIVGILDS